MIALKDYEANLCPKCGGPVNECTDPRNEFRFKTDLPTRCHRTTSQLIAAEAAKDAPHSRALMFATQMLDG